MTARPVPSSDAPVVTVSPETDIVDSTAAGPAALRGSLLLGGSYMLTIALSLVSAPLLIRHLAIAGFGRYSTVIALVTILNGLTDAGLVNITLREWASRTGEDRRRLMQSLLGVRLMLSATGVIGGVGFAVIAGYGETLVIGTLVAGVGMIFQATANMLVVSLQGELRFGWASAISVLRQAVTTALIVALVIAGAGILPLLSVTIVAGLVSLALTAWVVRDRMPLVPSFHDPQWRPLVRDTLPYSAAIALNTLYLRVTIVVMSLIATADQTGYFATSFRVTEVLIGIPALAIGAAFPILSRSAHQDRDRFAYAAQRIFELATIAGVGLALVAILSAPFVIDVLAGSAGAPAASVLQIQALTLVATFLTTASGFVFLSLRRHVLLLVANIGALLANVALTFVLVPIAHARGAAIAAVIAESCLSLGLLLKLIRVPGVHIRLLSLLTVVGAGAVAAAPLLVDSVTPILRTIAGLAIYAAGLALLGRIPPEVRHIFQRSPGQRVR